MKIDWHRLTAEEVVKLLEGRPVVLGPWIKDHGNQWHRMEVEPVKEAQNRLAIFVGLTRGRAPGAWFADIGSFGSESMISFETTFHVSQEKALAAADSLAVERGWKLLKGRRA